MKPRPFCPTLRHWCVWATCAALVVAAGVQTRAQQAPLRKIGELELAIRGLSATTEATQTLPKNVASGVRIAVRAGAQALTAADAARFLGTGFTIQGELSGPGVPATQTIASTAADPLLVPIPPLQAAGAHTVANLRIVRDGHTMLDVAPHTVTLDVIEQVLITSVKTRPLTLDEIKARGIVLDSDDYLGFEFTIGMKLESSPVSISFPAVFDRQGVPVPQPLTPPSVSRLDVPVPTMVPVLLEVEAPPGQRQDEKIPLTTEDGRPITIPGVLVIPGNVGYLKQFFSAQLFVANGAPAGTPLTLHDVTGKIKLPDGKDLIPKSGDEPLSLAQTETGVHEELPVRGVGTDGEPGTGDDIDVLQPGAQGQAEFLIRGDLEGFHTIDFDIRARLDGLPIGPVTVKGKASGGVLVRNAQYDITFTAPAVVRAGEEFTLYATVTNIGQGIGNDVSVTVDTSRQSGVELPQGASPTQRVATLMPGDAATLEYRFVSTETGQVVASYLNFDTNDAVSGRLNFRVALGERGVPLSPDTLVLPSVIDDLPDDVVLAAMRVLGQAYSAVNAPAGTLPPGVVRPGRDVVTAKALALAEAGLRHTLGQPMPDVLRDLALDFYAGTRPAASGSTGGVPPPARLDVGFDQVLRDTNAGYALARALGNALVEQGTVSGAGGPVGFERAFAQVAVSGPEVISFLIDSNSGGGAASPIVDVALSDAAGRRSVAGRSASVRPASAVPGAVMLPLGLPDRAPTFGLISIPSNAPYTLELGGRESGQATIAFTMPDGQGGFVHATAVGLAITPLWRGRLVLDPARSGSILLEQDLDGDGTTDVQQPIAAEPIQPQGARLISANIIGPETIEGAGPFGFHAVLVFDRPVDGDTASAPATYTIPSNRVLSAKAVMSQRIVMASLEQPEGPYLPTSLAVSGMPDWRGAMGPSASTPLASRLRDMGAIVSGRVFTAEGTPVAKGEVVYSNNPDYRECKPQSIPGFAKVALDASGRYEFRYVRRDNCGWAFTMTTTDPATGAAVSVSRYVRAPGEQIVADLALFGRGSVTGTVRDLNGQPVGGADVVVVSSTDNQIGGRAMTDGQGRYLIANITVGAFTVRAVKGTSAGHSAGRIDRAGTTADVNVTLDGGTVNVSGRVFELRGSEQIPLPGVSVGYRVSGVNVGATTTDAQGKYVFVGMPTGAFRIEALVDPYTRGFATGFGEPNQTITDRDIAIDRPDTGTVTGVVFLPGTPQRPAPNVIVTIAGRATLTDADGRFVMPDIPIGTQSVAALTRDQRRSGIASVTLTHADQTVETSIVLSALGRVVFTVLDSQGLALKNVQVRRLDCSDPCGCGTVQTDNDGRVAFEPVGVGVFRARAFVIAGGFTDTATGEASVTREGDEAHGTIRVNGAGTVTGRVLDHRGQPSFGADIELRSLHFVNDGFLTCGLVDGISHRVRTDVDGLFRIPTVNVGPVAVTASQAFLPTKVGAQGALTRAGDTVSFELRLVNTISGELSGRVFLPDGVTTTGAGVEVTANGMLPDVTVKTDATGLYRFAKIFPEGRYTLTARDPVTGGTTQMQIYLQANQDVTHDLRLKGRGVVRVSVVTPTDAPVAQAYVRLAETDYPNQKYEQPLEPEDDGVVTFDRVFEGPISVEAFDALGRGGRASATIPEPGATIDVKVRVNPTGTVTGRVLMPGTASPVPFATVKLIAADGRVIGQVTSEGSGDVGSFQFDYVPAGPFRLEAVDPLTARTGVAFGTIEREGQSVLVDVIAQALGTVRGTVTKNDVDQPGAHVEVRSGPFRVTTVADDEGAYLVHGVPEGDVVVTASLDQGLLQGSAGARLVGEGTELTIDVALRGSGTVSGRVLTWNGQTAAPLSVVTITVGGVGGGTQSMLTLPGGLFEFPLVPAGSATLSADVIGSIDRGRVTVQVPVATVVNADITLNGLGALRVHAFDSGDQPVAGTIRVEGLGTFPYVQTVAAGPDGIALLPELLAGPVRVRLEVNGGSVPLYGVAEGTVVPGTTADLDVRLQPSGTITGRVKRADGQTDAIGTTVTIDLDHGRGRIVIAAGQEGRFEARGVPTGGFQVKLHDPLTSGLALVTGQTLANGQARDLGTIVLDDQAVQVSSVEPADGAIGISLTQRVRITFTDPIVSTAGVSFRKNGESWHAPLTLEPDGRSVTSDGPWPSDAQVEVVVSTALTDIFGRHPAQAFTSRFRTVDRSPPQVTAIAPVNTAIQVPVDGTIVVTFNEPIGPTTDLSSLISVSSTAGTVLGTATVQPEQPVAVIFTPAQPLADNAIYIVVVNGAIDLDGNRQTTAFSSTFATTDTVPPALTLNRPSPSGTWVSELRPRIEILATDAVSGLDMSSRALFLGADEVSTLDHHTWFEHVPAEDLEQRLYELTARVRDRAGNEGTLTATFGVDITPPSAAQITGITQSQVLQGNVAIGATATDTPSGVARIELFVDGRSHVVLTTPSFQIALNTASLADGPHTLTARAVDLAGNTGPFGTPVDVLVDNHTLTVTITSPAANSRHRDTVNVAASVNEVVNRVEFSVGTEPPVVDTSSPYAQTLPLANVPEGAVFVNATAFAPGGHSSTARVAIVIDRTPPSPPDATLITAEPPIQGYSLVFGRQGAVEARAVVDITNTITGARATAIADAQGSFAANVAAATGHQLSLIAIDDQDNASAPTTIVVRDEPSLPPTVGSTTVTFEGVLADRVGPGRAALAPDGNPDALFTVTVSVGEGVQRQLKHVDLAGPLLRSTRPEVNAVLGVAAMPDAPFLNNLDGQVAFPITSTTRLSLFASSAGFIVPGATYTVTLTFTDGSRFVADTTIVAPEDKPQVARSMTIGAASPTVAIAAGQPGSTTVTLTDIRDVDGAIAPDGVKVAIAVANMASKDPRGRDISSAGGTIVDGEPAVNNVNFRVFPVANGSVTATYQSDPVTPGVLIGTSAVVQVLPADEAGHVLGTEAIATYNLALRAASDRALVTVESGSLYGDGADRRVPVRILVRDASGQPMPAGTRILVSAADCASLVPTGHCVSSWGGTIFGGDASGSYRLVTLASGGEAIVEYSAVGKAVGTGGVVVPRIQVLLANAAGGAVSQFALGTGEVIVVGAGAGEVSVTPDTLPMVSFSRDALVRVRHLRDARSNRVPDGARFLLSAADCAALTPTGHCFGSAGGRIVDGQSGPSEAYRLFTLTGGEMAATYNTNGLVSHPGDVKVALVQMVMAGVTGQALSQAAVGIAPVRLIAPLHAVGTATPSAILADDRLHTSTVRFFPILDADGNLLPDGSKVAVSVADCAGLLPTGHCIVSSGGQILDGTPVPSHSAYRMFTVEDGEVTVTYGDQDLMVRPGQQATANVVLLEANASGAPIHQRALGSVPITLVGLTSAVVTVSPGQTLADGFDRRVAVTVSDFKDTLGRPIPDGTVVAVTANDCGLLFPTGHCVVSAGGRIVGGIGQINGRPDLRLFAIQNGQVSFEYSAEGVLVASGQRIASIQVASSTPSGDLVSDRVIATNTITLRGPSTAAVTITPGDRSATGVPQLSQVVLSNLVDSGGNPLPEGAKVAVTIGNCTALFQTGACVSSVGGVLTPAGTTAGDGAPATNNAAYQLYTTAGGTVQASYSTGTLFAPRAQTMVARVAVVSASFDGRVLSDRAIGVGEVWLHGTTSAEASGPATVRANGGTATVTFTGIKDAVGNIVPDGTLVLATAANCATLQPSGACHGSIGGQIVDGTSTGSAFKLFSVVNGSVTVTYATSGASTGIATVQLAGARPDGTILDSRALTGGAWSLTVTP